ncbi:MAG TPA: type II toxin-antitoxin system Phd/YefM family antitoxin [Candidatus Hydrogenedentes bacterium]|nr:type II toxin-antitoxin system Phd/YefM family antitoxin [Candidatus Hydrogenedentota bacterium]
MTTMAIEQAQENFAKLIDDVTLGEHIVITRNHVPIAELIPVTHPNQKPVFGSAKGMISISEDFDAPMDDFQDYTA